MCVRKLTVFCVVSVVLLVHLFAFSSYAQGANLVVNGDFSSGDDSWSFVDNCWTSFGYNDYWIADGKAYVHSNRVGDGGEGYLVQHFSQPIQPTYFSVDYQEVLGHTCGSIFMGVSEDGSVGPGVPLHYHVGGQDTAPNYAYLRFLVDTTFHAFALNDSTFEEGTFEVTFDYGTMEATATVTTSSDAHSLTFPIPSIESVVVNAVYVGAINNCSDGRNDYEGWFDNVVVEGVPYVPEPIWAESILHLIGDWVDAEEMIGPPDGNYAATDNADTTIWADTSTGAAVWLDFGRIVHAGTIVMYHKDPPGDEHYTNLLVGPWWSSTSLPYPVPLAPDAGGTFMYGNIQGTGKVSLYIVPRDFRYVRLDHFTSSPDLQDGIDAIGLIEGDPIGCGRSLDPPPPTVGDPVVAVSQDNNGYWSNPGAIVGEPDGVYAWSSNPGHTMPSVVVDLGEVVYSGEIVVHHARTVPLGTNLQAFINAEEYDPDPETQPDISPYVIEGWEYLSGGSEPSGAAVLQFPPTRFRYIKLTHSQTSPGQHDGIDAVEVREEPRLLICAPHPDDETLMAAGIIRNAIDSDLQVLVAVLTNGDGYRDACAARKARETAAESARGQFVLGAAAVERIHQDGRTTDTVWAFAATSLGEPMPDLLVRVNSVPTYTNEYGYAAIWGCRHRDKEPHVVVARDKVGRDVARAFARQVSPDDYLALAEERQLETATAMALLGLPAERIVFLGYPDGGLADLPEDLPATNPYESETTGLTTTYSTDEFASYHATVAGHEADYYSTNLVLDLADIVQGFAPTDIYVTHACDTHSDHSAAYHLTTAACDVTGLSPRMHQAVIHWGPERHWPTPSLDAVASAEDRFTPTHSYEDLGRPDSCLPWPPEVPVLVPFEMQDPSPTTNLKRLAIEEYRTQTAVDVVRTPHNSVSYTIGMESALGYLRSFCKRDEVFWHTSDFGCGPE